MNWEEKKVVRKESGVFVSRPAVVLRRLPGALNPPSGYDTSMDDTRPWHSQQQRQRFISVLHCS